MKNRKANWSITSLLIAGSLFILFPLYLTITIAFKQPEEMTNNLLSLPESWTFSNFINAIEATNFFNAMGNSAFVAIFTIILSLIVHSLIAYAIARNLHKKSYKVIYYYIVSAMFVPFPVIMLPVVKQASALGLDNLIGLVLLNVVMQLALNVFIYTGYIKSIPKELEEAALIDGASTWGIFWRIIFPLMAPIHATVAILTGLFAWNDFMLPLVLLSETENYTLPLVQYAFQGEFSTDYNLAFSSYLMAMLPIIVLYVFTQKWIISGVMQGSGK